MAYTKGYFFNTLAKAKNKVDIINSGEGIPNKDGSTQTYCEPIKCFGGYYLPFDEVTCKYLTGEIDVEPKETPKI